MQSTLVTILRVKAVFDGDEQISDCCFVLLANPLNWKVKSILTNGLDSGNGTGNNRFVDVADLLPDLLLKVYPCGREQVASFLNFLVRWESDVCRGKESLQISRFATHDDAKKAIPKEFVNKEIGCESFYFNTVQVSSPRVAI